MLIVDFLKQTVELNHLFQKDRVKTASAARGTAELNRLFQKDRGKTASAARILSPNPTRRPFALSSNSILLLWLEYLAIESLSPPLLHFPPLSGSIRNLA